MHFQRYRCVQEMFAYTSSAEAVLHLQATMFVLSIVGLFVVGDASSSCSASGAAAITGAVAAIGAGSAKTGCSSTPRANTV